MPLVSRASLARLPLHSGIYNAVVKVWRLRFQFSALVYVVGKPAPDWNGTAVLNGDFQELRLADFKGFINGAVF